MTNKVNPIQNRKADAFKTAGAIAYGGHGDSGVIMDAANPSEISKQDGDIDETALGGFDYLSSSGLDVTIDAGEAFVFGAWLAIDTTTTVTLSSSPETVYVGWDKDRGTNNDVIIGVDGDFDNATANTDQRVAIWEFTNDGSSVTGSTDKRGSLGFENTATVFGREGDVTAQSGDYDHSQLSGVNSQNHHAPGDGLTDNSGTFDVTVSDFAGTLLSDDGSNNLQVNESSISHDNINQASVDSQDHHSPGDGLTDNSGTFDVTVSDFAGTLLSDDGSNNLQVDEGSISHDNINQTSVSSQDHHAPGDGLTDNSGTFDVSVSDFAGTLLSDDGSNNLQVDEGSISHDNLSGGTASDAHHPQYTDSDAVSAVDAEVTNNNSVSEMDTQVSTNDTDIDSRSRIWVQETKPTTTPRPAPDRDGGGIWHELGEIATSRWFSQVSGETSSRSTDQVLWIPQESAVIARSRGYLASFDISDGSKNWERASPSEGGSSIVYSDSTSDVISMAGSAPAAVASFNLSDGTQNWKTNTTFDTAGERHALTILPNEGQVAVGGHDNTNTSESGIRKLNLSDGAEDSDTFLTGTESWQIEYDSSNSYLIYTTGSTVGALDPANINAGPLWEDTSATGVYIQGITLSSGLLYLTTTDGEVRRLLADGGSSASEWSTIPLNGNSGEATRGDMQYNSSQNILSVIDGADIVGIETSGGTESWRYNTGDAIEGGSAQIGDDNVVYGNNNTSGDSVYAVSMTDGSEVWTYNPGTDVGSGFAYSSSEEIASFIDRDNDVYSLRTEREIDGEYTSDGSQWIEVP